MHDHYKVIRQHHQRGFCNIIDAPYVPNNCKLPITARQHPRHLTHIWYGESQQPVSFIAFSIDFAQTVACQEIGLVISSNRDKQHFPH